MSSLLFHLLCHKHLSVLLHYLNKHYFYWLGNVTSFHITLSYFSSLVSLEFTLGLYHTISFKILLL